MRGNIQLVKEINSASIISLLYRSSPLSRVEIAARTKLSAATVSSLVDELLAEGMIEEAGERPSTGAGRPAIALQINSRGGCVIGFEAGPRLIQGVLMDLKGHEIDRFTEEVKVSGTDSESAESGSSQQRFISGLEKAIVLGRARADALQAGSLKGIGISVPGIVSEDGQSIVYSSRLSLRSASVVPQLAARYPEIPIRLVNDSNAAAMAEHYGGLGRGGRHLLYLTVREGVGAGLILGGQLFKGHLGGAGEVGHVPVLSNGELCECGKRGCLETVIASDRVLHKVREAGASRDESLPERIEDVVRLYDSGAPEVQPIVEQVLNHVAQLLAIAAGFVSPEVIVMDGWFAQSEKFMKELALECKARTGEAGRPDLHSASYGANGPLNGAATMMLQQLFKAPEWA